MERADASAESSLQPLISPEFLVQQCRAHWRLLFLIVPLFMLGTVGYINIAAPVYTATAVLVPIDTLDGNVTTAPSKLQTLVGSETQGSSVIDEFAATLQSAKLAHSLATQKDIMSVMFRDDWDADRHAWKSPGMLTAAADIFRRALHIPVKHVPNEYDVIQFLQENLTGSKSVATSFVTVSLKFDSEAGAERILQATLNAASTIVRAEQREKIAARISYLKRALPKAETADLRDQISDLLSVEDQAMMLMSADPQYGVISLDYASASDIATWPKVPVVFILSFYLSILCWIFVALIIPKGQLLPFSF